MEEYLTYLLQRNEQKPVEWSEEDEKMMQTIQVNVDRCDGKWTCCGEVCPISRCLPWLKSLKPQTSHESNEMIDQIKTQIALCNGFNRENRDKIFALLDSLRPKKQWKPSDEQLEKLHYAMCNFGGDVFKKLDSLYNDLKRLKGE